MKIFKNALLSLILACTFCIATPISGLAAAEATTPVESPAPDEEYAPAIAEDDQIATESQSIIDNHVKREHERMQEYIAWSQAKWEAHIDRTINFWKNHHNYTDEQTEIPDGEPKHPFMGDEISDHITRSADWLTNHIEQSEQRLLDHIKWIEIRHGNTEEVA